MKLLGVGIVIVIGLSGDTARMAASSVEGTRVARWEYRVLSKEQLLDLGKKDLAAGLNILGDQGWELIAFKDGYLFKRPKEQRDGPSKEVSDAQRKDLKSQIVILEGDVDLQKERVAWTARMVKKGFLAASSIQLERQRLKWAEIVLDRARTSLEALAPYSKAPLEMLPKPQK